MWVTLQIMILAVLLLIFIQDKKSRSVLWVLFPLLAILLIAARFQLHRQADLVTDCFLNVAFIILQLLLVSCYFSIKSRRWINITNDMLGWGDILLLISICGYLSVFNYVVFYLASLIASLFFWLTFQKLVAQKDHQIPLAGMQALIFAAVLTLTWWVCPVNLNSDEWLLTLYSK